MASGRWASALATQAKKARRRNNFHHSRVAVDFTPLQRGTGSIRHWYNPPRRYGFEKETDFRILTRDGALPWREDSGPAVERRGGRHERNYGYSGQRNTRGLAKQVGVRDRGARFEERRFYRRRQVRERVSRVPERASGMVGARGGARGRRQSWIPNRRLGNGRRDVSDE